MVELARECIDTPFQHQGRIPGLGLDCVGLIRYPAMSIGIFKEDYTNYGRQPVPELMGSLLDRYFDRIDANDAKPGDIFWLRLRNDPTHLALLSERDTLIHATERGVVEHGFRGVWKTRVHRAYRYKGIDE